MGYKMKKWGDRMHSITFQYVNECGVRGAGCGVWGTGCEVQGARCRV